MAEMFERRVLTITIDPEGELDSFNPRGDCTATDCKKTCKGPNSTGGLVLHGDDRIHLELDARSVLEFLRQPPRAD